jgi:hypothetical protein
MGSGYDLIDYLDKFLGNLDQTDRQTIIEFITDKAFCRRLRNCYSTLEKILQQRYNIKILINVEQVDFNMKIISIRVLRKQGSDIHRQFWTSFIHLTS